LIDFFQRVSYHSDIANEGFTFRENKSEQHDIVSKMAVNNHFVTDN